MQINSTNKYGSYSSDGKEFIITEKDIPRNWYNYLWNDDYITFISQTGAGNGCFQCPMGERIELVSDRCLFLLEDDRHWGVSGLPVEELYDKYSCTHGLGYTMIHTENYKIATDLAVFVPNHGYGELWKLKLKNLSAEDRKVRVMGYCGTDIDEKYSRQGYNTNKIDYYEDINGLLFKGYAELFGKVNTCYYSYMALSEKLDGYNGSVNEFIGPYGSFAHPKAVERGFLTNVGCNGEKIGLSLEKHIEMKPGEEKEIVFICAISFSENAIKESVDYYSDPKNFDKELEAVKKKFASQISGVTIQTPDQELNKMFFWLKHQANLGSRWARVRHNGFRDMTSDCECLAAFNPDLALERFKRVLEFQYSNGYAPRTVKNGKICDNNFSDNGVWITFTANAILSELGDIKILDIPVKFNDGSTGTIYEHVRRSVEFLYHFRGNHNLIKIWGGDWNDCMNYAGIEGKGVSIWLSLAWLRANDMFSKIAELHGNKEDAGIARLRSKEMRDLIEKHGWDGEYYLCAYGDEGDKIGSHTNKEGKMFLIPQIWAVFSNVSNCGREITAMDSVKKYLSTPLGTVVSNPPYTEYDAKVGSVTKKVAGMHENGGVYLHTIAWKIAADAILKRATEVEADLETILPFRNKIVDGRAEPYVLCNSYFGIQTGYRYGTPGQSWRTAAGQWLEKAIVNYVYGLMPEIEGLRVSPCLPPSWKKCGIKKRFRDAVYEISFENHGTNIKEILVNGEAINGNILPYKSGEKYFVVVKTE